MIFFFIKSIFLVIVNKIPHSKKILEILSNSPSPPMWNNWLSHLLNLYSFVINIYFFSSPLLSSNNFFVSSHLFFFSFFSHKATRSRRMAVNGPFQRPYQSISAVILARIGPYQPFRPKLDYIDRFDSHFRWNRAD